MSAAPGAVKGGAHTPAPHDSAHKHVTGRAAYIDDMPEPAGTLHAYLGLSRRAHARIAAMDLSAVLEFPGVAGVLTAADIPGENDVSPMHLHDDPVFADGAVEFYGQPLFAVVAETRAAARRAARRAEISYEPLKAAVDLADALAAGAPCVTAPMTLARGDCKSALCAAPHRVKGAFRTGGQDHFYLEGHIALAVPGEDGEMTVWSSTQHPGEVQHMTAKALGTPAHAVTVNVRRMGGGFGGKETQANLFAVAAAAAAKKLNRPVKLRPDRDDDMTATGKRHDFMIEYDAGFDGEGRITAVDAVFTARCGFSADLSGPVTDRALFHADNAYYYPNVRLRSRPLKTNTVSNTAFRGFGGPQGVLGAERIIEEIAYHLGKDPLEVRKANLYGGPGRDITPYHQQAADCPLERLIAELEKSSDYAARRRRVIEFNARGGVIRRGIALTPVKFGIAFTATHYNQAGALVHVYKDGSILLNHGGTEMGQGLLTKTAQIAAECFQVDLPRIRVTGAATAKVPNTSATAASSGSDLNGMAVWNAASQIKDRLTEFAAEKWGVSKDRIVFEPNFVRAGNQRIAFDDLAAEAYAARVHLSAAGFYKTPGINWDRAAGKGRPFHYFACGAAVSEVSLDTLTGEHRIDRVDILHDAGKSLNPAVDLGQIEGGFVQGAGWLTCEELWWDAEGRLRTHAPSTYKIPLASDRPQVFNVSLAEWPESGGSAVLRSKAVGEPPLMLAASVLEALSMAAASAADYKICPRLDAPATPERMLAAVERLGRGG